MPNDFLIASNGIQKPSIRAKIAREELQRRGVQLRPLGDVMDMQMQSLQNRPSERPKGIDTSLPLKPLGETIPIAKLQQVGLPQEWIDKLTEIK